MPIDHVLGALDFTAAFVVMSCVCALVALYVMQATWHDASSQMDGAVLNWIRRVGFIIIALGLVWRLAESKPPTAVELLLVLGLFLMFSVRAVILFHHRHDTTALLPNSGRARQIIH